ncbi:hypothetical protein CYMTET_12417, partial [Cymbomonas tetramitiformis]
MEAPLMEAQSRPTLSVTRGSQTPPLFLRTLIDHYEQTASAHPHREAIILPETKRRITFLQLHRHAISFANGLRQLGVKRGDRFAVWLGNCEEWAVAMLGCAQAGVTLVAFGLDYRGPQARHALKLSEASALLMYGQFGPTDFIAIFDEAAPNWRKEGHFDELPSLKNVFILDKNSWEGVRGYASMLPDIETFEADGPAPHDAQFIYFTSGSTGLPKGVVLSGAQVVANSYFNGLRKGVIGGLDVAAVTQPFSHIGGLVVNFLSQLVHGVTNVMTSAAFDPRAVLQSVQEECCTVMDGVPSQFTIYLNLSDLPSFDLAALCKGAIGAAAIPKELLDSIVGKGLGQSFLCVTFGMTETSPISMHGSPEDSLVIRQNSVGRCNSHAEAKVIDPLGRAVPCGCPGELCIRGFLVTDGGYWQQPDKTIESVDAEGWMHTGDQAVIDVNGFVNITGRLKDLIIRGGENIMPKEIEDNLNFHEAVKEACVVGIPSTLWGEEVCSWVTLKVGFEGTPDLTAELRDFLATRIADFKIPEFVLYTKQFIKTGSGKIQKMAMQKKAIALIKEEAEAKKRASGPTEALQPLLQLGLTERVTEIQSLVTDLVSSTLNLDVDLDQPLMASGMNSRGANTLRAAINDTLGIELPGTLAFDYPSVGTMAGFLAKFIAPEDELLASEEAGGLVGEARGAHNIHVVQYVSQMPVPWHYEDEKLRPFRGDNLRVLPISRSDGYDLQELYDSNPVQFGALLLDVDLFDASPFALSGQEAQMMDPQQRLLLENVQEVLGGDFPRRPEGTNIAAMVGIVNVDYFRLQLKLNDAVSAYTAPGLALGVASGRISYTFGLIGPAASIDTACSSSLLALHGAYSAIHRNECDDGLATGVNLSLTPEASMLFNRSGMMAADGRCKALDNTADGYVRGEGCVVVRLVPLEVEEEERSVGRLAASIINQDGPSSALTAPNGPSQHGAITSALRYIGATPSDMLCLQMHGTGTGLGDPIEVGAAAGALVETRKRSAAPLTLMALKACLGHGEAVAGLMGVVQTLRNFHSWESPALPHLKTMNPHVAFPLGVQRCAGKSRATRVASMLPCLPATCTSLLIGTSSFGFSGTNAHTVVAPGALAVPGAGVPAGCVVREPYRTRFWIAPKMSWLLQSSAVDGAGTAQRKSLVIAPIQGATSVYLWHHIVAGKAIVPGAGFFEIALSGGMLLSKLSSASVTLVANTIPAPLPLPDITGPNTGVIATLSIDASGKMELFSLNAAGSQSRHLMGQYARVSERPKPDSCLVTFPASQRVLGMRERYRASRATLPIASQAHYPCMAEMAGLQYGPAFQLLGLVMREADMAGGVAIGAIDVDDPKCLSGYYVHPAVQDAALQLGIAAHTGDKSIPTRVPASLAALCATGRVRGVAMWAKVAEDKEGADLSVVRDHWLMETSGALLTEANTLTAKSLGGAGASGAAAEPAVPFVQLLYDTQWQACAPSEPPELRPVPCDHKVIRAGLSELCGTSEPMSLRSGVLSKSASRTIAATHRVAAAQGSTFYGSGRMALPMAPVNEFLGMLRSAIGHTALQQADAVNGLVLASRGMYGVVETPCLEVSLSSRLHAAVFRGLVATAEQEVASITAALFDEDNHAAHLGLQEVSGDMHGVARRGGATIVPRLMESWTLPKHENAKYLPMPRGSFKSLLRIGCKRTEKLAPGEMEVKTHATGLNFRDVLNVLGMYPGEPGDPGADMAGIITGMASDLDDGHPLSPYVGQPVFGLGEGVIRTYCTIHEELLRAKPANVGFEGACAVATVFVTVNVLTANFSGPIPGRLPPIGALVHAASGGVGLAASQVLNAGGMATYGTAGSPSKRTVLRQLGQRVQIPSRDTSFSSELAPLGLFPGVVFNSLTSAGMIASTLSCLDVGARWCEIGKREIWSEPAMLNERRDMNYLLVAVDFLTQRMLSESLSWLTVNLANGTFDPLMGVLYSFDQTRDAFMGMSKARHVGKVLIAMPNLPVAGLNTTNLVSGGMGSLGLLISSWMAEMGTLRYVLGGRSGRGGEGLRELMAQSSKASTSFVRWDAGLAEETGWVCRRTLSTANITLLHAGGVLMDSLIDNQNIAKMHGSFAPKIHGLAHLQEGLQATPVASAVLFSSVAALLASSGQANYVAANSALDVWAQASKAVGNTWHSVQWGAWGGGGMASQNASTVGRLERLGMGILEPESGLAALGSLLTHVHQGGAKVVPLGKATANPFNFEKFLAPTGGVGTFVPALYEEFLDCLVEKEDAVGLGGEGGGKVSREQCALMVSSSINDAVEAVIGESVDAGEPLMDAGLDSLGSVELRNALTTKLGLQLPGTLVFDYPSVEAMAEYLVETMVDHLGITDDVDEEDEDTVVEAGLGDLGEAAGFGPSHLAIRACASLRDTKKEMESFDLIGQVPYQRWDTDRDMPVGFASNDKPGMTVRFGGYMHDVDLFDMASAGISAAEATLMDPQQRLMMEAARESLMAMGKIYEGGKPSNNLATFTGVVNNEYAKLQKAFAPTITTYTATGIAFSVVAGRIAYYFGLTGPCAAVDTACSSSLVATHMGYSALQRKESVGAAVGGVNLTLGVEQYCMFNASGMLTPDGRCKTLDKAADGYVRGEGCCLFALAHLTAEPAAPQSLLGLVVGSCLNQDGRSSSLTAPNGPSQQAAIQQGLHSASVTPDVFTCLQMHGTGTALGDPIEVGAAFAVLFKKGKDYKGRPPLEAGSAKSTHGHTEASAGVVGLLHLISRLSGQGGNTLMHLTTVNPHITNVLDMMKPEALLPRQASPFAPMHHGAAVDQHCLAVGGVSSFAFQGTNGHCLAGVAPNEGAQLALGRLSTWERIRVWVHPRASALANLSSPAPKKEGTVRLFGMLGSPLLGYLWDHQVGGRALLPLTASLEAATCGIYSTHRAPDSASIAVVQLSLSQPIELKEKGVGLHSVAVRVVVDAPRGTFEVAAADGHAPGRALGGRAVSGHIRDALSVPVEVAVAAMPPLSANEQSLAQICPWWLMDSMGRPTIKMRRHAAGLITPQLVEQNLQSHRNHPAAMDNCLHVGLSWGAAFPRPGVTRETRVPASVQAFCGQAVGRTLWGVAQEAKLPLSGEGSLVDHCMFGTADWRCVELQGLEARAISAKPAAKTATAKRTASGVPQVAAATSSKTSEFLYVTHAQLGLRAGKRLAASSV